MTPAHIPFARVLTTAAGAILFLLAIAVESGHSFGWVRPDVLAALGGTTLDPPGRHSLATLALLLATVWGADRALASWSAALAYLLAGVLVAPVAPWPWMVQWPSLVAAGVLIAFIVTGRGTPRWRLTALETCWRRAATWERALAVLATVLAIVAVVAEMGELRNVISRKSDFGTFWRAAEAVRIGGDPYQVANREYFYPPTFAIALIPLTWVSIAHASVIWFALKVVMVVASLRMTYTLLEGVRLPGAARGWFATGIVLVACRFWMTDLRFGNTNVVILFLSLSALALAERGRDRASGAALAIAATIKLVPGVLAGWFLASRRYSALTWFVVWLGVVNLAPWVLQPGRVGGLWSSYRAHGVEQRMNAPLDEPDNQSLRGALARTVADPGTVRMLWLLLILAIATVTMGTSARLQLTTVTGRTVAASTFFLYGLLASPGSWVVHYSAALLPLAAALRLLLEPGPRRMLLALAFVLANLVYTGSALSRPTVRLAGERSLFVVATLLLLAALLWELRRTNPRSPAPSARPAPPPPPPPDHR